LPALDNLERAVAHEGAAEASAILDGVRLVLKQLLGTLEKFGVHAFDSVGQAFDPALHEAISQLETTEHPAGTVTSQLQKGYRIGKRLLRPALVVVAKPRAGAADGAGNDRPGSGEPEATAADREPEDAGEP